jgi:HlyD family secretion protein
MISTTQAHAEASIRKQLWLGTTVVAVLLVGIGGWAALANISGAVIAPGIVVVDSNDKKIQHPTGGIIGQLLVKEGDHVNAGDVLVRLDATLTRANLAITSKALDEQLSRKARLETELEGRDAIEFPQALLDRKQDSEVGSRIESEQRVFDVGRAAREGQKKQLNEQIAQSRESIEGYQVREQAKAQEIVLIKRELEGVRELWSKNLIQISKLTALGREATQLEGERGQLMSLIAETKGKIAETELRILQVDSDLRNEVGRELREVEAKIGELVERKVAAEDQLKHIEIKAPQSGHVHQLSVHTVGGVIAAGEQLMLIVPDNDKLGVDIRVRPTDVDQLHAGQATKLRFTAFNVRSTPQINGILRRISADVQTDEHAGKSYYVAHVDVAENEFARLGELRVIPGMPVEAFVMTEKREAISYLLKPLMDQMQRALREE